MKSISLPKEMKALVFQAKGKIEIVKKPVPQVGPNDLLIKVTTTTICGTDIHIKKGEYPVVPGLTIGHESVGTVAAYGDNVTGFELGERVLAGAITPSGFTAACQYGQGSQDGVGEVYGYKATAGWKFGNIEDGCQAEYVLVKNAMANVAKIPATLTDKQVLMCPDILSTGIKGSENADIVLGDTVVLVAQGPIGLSATIGAKLLGASTIIAVDGEDARLEMSKKYGATHTINFKNKDVVEEVRRITNGRMADAAVECLGLNSTFQTCLRVLRPGGKLSSIGVYSEDLVIPLDSFAAGLGDHQIKTSLCPGGSERMRRLMQLIENGMIDTTKLVTHEYDFDKIVEAYELFESRKDGVLKIAVKVS
ncbi:zinc-binding dehydrogenase [Mycoplasma anserisalpingitidis]|uniref:zinc-binding dehydrogenase n=1 Tax=Mycoplasma anserisalpingitidis TaxID=519450 RepID=UPI001CF7072A|nr:zinc-binding dehydrogenase [Mycoplasma anserisalpingitidis]UCU26768.1 zinc-binding dehydrogenase [Mycoplasma anserisalpingitidis]UCU27607.1 zinc-binding dehydrogenase [Mycoplasma anserisalpingitidis]